MTKQHRRDALIPPRTDTHVSLCADLGRAHSQTCRSVCTEPQWREAQVCEASLRKACEGQSVVGRHDPLCHCWMPDAAYQDYRHRLLTEKGVVAGMPLYTALRGVLDNVGMPKCWYAACSTAEMRPAEPCPSSTINLCFQSMQDVSTSGTTGNQSIMLKCDQTVAAAPPPAAGGAAQPPVTVPKAPAPPSVVSPPAPATKPATDGTAPKAPTTGAAGGSGNTSTGGGTTKPPATVKDDPTKKDPAKDDTVKKDPPKDDTVKKDPPKDDTTQEDTGKSSGMSNTTLALGIVSVVLIVLALGAVVALVLRRK